MVGERSFNAVAVFKRDNIKLEKPKIVQCLRISSVL